MTSLEKYMDLGYLFLTLKPPKININTCNTFCCIYWYVSIYSEECFWPQYMYPKLGPFNGYRWCPLGKLSHLGLEQLSGHSKWISETTSFKSNGNSIFLHLQSSEERRIWRHLSPRERENGGLRVKASWRQTSQKYPTIVSTRAAFVSQAPKSCETSWSKGCVGKLPGGYKWGRPLPLFPLIRAPAAGAV